VASPRRQELRGPLAAAPAPAARGATRGPGLRAGSRLASEGAMKYGLLWLLGVPIPVLIVLYLLFH
jgi:hypothetical protein